MSGRRNTILGFNLTSSDDSFAQTVGRVDFAPNGFLRIVRSAFSFPNGFLRIVRNAFSFLNGFLRVVRNAFSFLNGFLRVVRKFFEVEDRLSDASSRAFQFRERSLIGRE